MWGGRAQCGELSRCNVGSSGAEEGIGSRGIARCWRGRSEEGLAETVDGQVLELARGPGPRRRGRPRAPAIAARLRTAPGGRRSPPTTTHRDPRVPAAAVRPRPAIPTRSAGRRGRGSEVQVRGRRWPVRVGGWQMIGRWSVGGGPHPLLVDREPLVPATPPPRRSAPPGTMFDCLPLGGLERGPVEPPPRSGPVDQAADCRASRAPPPAGARPARSSGGTALSDRRRRPSAAAPDLEHAFARAATNANRFQAPSSRGA